MQDVYKVLEWNRVEEMISEFTRTEIGKAKSFSILPCQDNELKDELSRLEEMENCFNLLGRLPVDSSADLSHLLELAEKGGCLSIDEIESVAHDVILSHDLRNYMAKATNAPLLNLKITNMPNCDYLEKDIHKIIAPDLSIFDNASPTLHHIRLSLHRLEKQMTQELGYVLEENKIYLSDTNLTMRNGHYVIPVANAYKNKVNGIVQDVSGSGGTTFIEPERLVKLNNQMAILKNEERDEIHRLLLELSHEVGGSGESLKQINALIGYFDFLQAKVLFGEKLHCHIGSISDDGTLYIPSARHPLLDQTKVVSNDFHIGSKQRIIIISGPNAGGKTVALKTLGLLCLMFSCALPLPCLSGAIIPQFKHIFVDIGDSQSIRDNLSTFSGHMANIASICQLVGGKDLVLFDETGTGTSPKEGEALAKAITSFLLKKHCIALISSHFEGLKAYAFDNKEVENASMLFDEEKLLPTYKLKLGLPGDSYGLKVAKRFGLEQSIVEEAEREIEAKGDIKVSEAVRRLSALSRETEELKESLNKSLALAEAKEAKLKEREKRLEEKEASSLARVSKEKEELLYKAKREIDEVIRSLQSPEVKLHQAIEAKKKLEAFEEKETEETFNETLNVGDYAELPSYGVIGKITRIQGKKVTLTTSDGFSFESEKSKIKKAKEPESKKVSGSSKKLDSVGFGKSVPMDINLIGLHVDEAMSALDKYLDACRTKGYSKVRVIHGYGSGALREATKDYLKKHASFVKKFELGGEFDGGSGATIVYFK